MTHFFRTLYSEIVEPRICFRPNLKIHGLPATPEYTLFSRKQFSKLDLKPCRESVAPARTEC